MSYELEVHGLSDIGQVRQENQDSLMVHEPEEETLKRRRGTLVIVADGMGGLNDGKVASQLAVDRIVSQYYSAEGEASEALHDAVQAANKVIFEYAQNQGNGQSMGSTCTALVLLDKYACVAQVGDSRAYRYHRGEIRQVTRDHSLVRELLDRGEIEADSAQYTFHRNVLTRGLGLREEVDVDLFELADLESGDLFILTSDGLHEYVKVEEFVALLGEHSTGLESYAKALIATANERGGSDNITVGLAALGTVTPPPQAAAIDAPGEEGDTAELDDAVESGGKTGCLLPLAIVFSFAAGVAATLLMENVQLQDLEIRVQGSIFELETTLGEDTSDASRLEASLRRTLALLRP